MFHTRLFKHLVCLLLVAFFVVEVGGCAYLGDEQFKSDRDKEREKRGKITGESGVLGIFGGSSNAEPEGAALGVNAFLWRATLDTLSIFPVASADPHGGVILTDWYAAPPSPGERFKLNVYILDRALRADGVRVAVFRQVRNTGGEWQEAAVQPETAARLEEAILMRARQLRNQAAQGE